MRLFLIFIFSVNCGFIFAQQQFGCGVQPIDSATAVNLPWYDNNQALSDYLQARIGTTDPSARGDSNPLYFIPVRLVIYRDNAGSELSSISSAFANDILDATNDIFFNAQSAIQFYVVDVDFVNNNFYRTDISDFGNTIDLFASNKEYGPVNIHFIKNTKGSFSNTSGYAISPFYPAVPTTEWSCFVRTHGAKGRGDENVQNDFDEISTTLAHELGHVFGLLHTHHPGRLLSLASNDDNATIENSCYQEFRSRVAENYWYDGCTSTNNKKKCQINGDFLCDTEADPNVSYEEFSNGQVKKGSG